jgi:hypothetical protein
MNGPADRVVASDRARQWPCVIALVTAPFLPATTARRTNGSRLSWAFLVHLGGMALCYLVTSLNRTPYWSFWFFLRPFHWTYDLVAMLIPGKGFRAGPTVLSLLLLEAMFLILAGILMSWGPAMEPLGASYRHALRRLWLHTGQLLLLIGGITALAIGLNRLGGLWEARLTASLPPRPTYTGGMPRRPDEVREYHRRLQEWGTVYTRERAIGSLRGRSWTPGPSTGPRSASLPS